MHRVLSPKAGTAAQCRTLRDLQSAQHAGRPVRFAPFGSCMNQFGSHVNRCRLPARNLRQSFLFIDEIS
jgi:hypothetical protein